MDKRGGIDGIFDIAESALGGLETALNPADEKIASQKRSQNQIIDAEFTEVWEHELHWASAGAPNKEAWHCIPEATLRSLCGIDFPSHHIHNRQKLPHGMQIVACTSCIIGVSKRG